MLTAILTILGNLVPVILNNTGVIGTSTETLIQNLLGPIASLFTSLATGKSATSDFLAALAALSGVVVVLKATPNMPATALTLVNDIDLDIQSALSAFATAGQGYNPNLYVMQTHVA